MFCIKCGTQLPDDAQFCMSCGIRIGDIKENVATNDTSTERYSVKIVREKQWFAVDPGIEVFVDNTIVKTLGSEESVTVLLNKGQHHFDFHMTFRKRDLVIDLRENTIIILKINRMWGTIEARLGGE